MLPVLIAILVLSCCTGIVFGTDASEIEMKSAEINTYNQPTLDVLNSPSTERTNQSVKTVIPNPAYVNIAPCPCNLMTGTCDVHCCCDKDCSADDIQTFRCISGSFGGYDVTTSETHCSSTYFNRPGWFPITCIVDANTGTGFLGYFYYPVAFLQSLRGRSIKYSYNESQCILPDEPGTCARDYPSAGYKQGIAVKTGLRAASNGTEATHTGPNYILALPRRAMGNRCTWMAPVQFLVDSGDICDLEVSAKTCSENRQLNALLYVRQLLTTGPVVLEQQNRLKIASTKVNFRCAGNVTTSLHVKSTASPVASPNEASHFGTNIAALNDAAVVQLQNCSWDDGSTHPPAPSNPSPTQCENVVLRVEYAFTWSGQTISSLVATVVLGNVSLPENITSSNNSVVIVTQTFTALFVGKTTETTSNNTMNITNTTETNPTSSNSDLVYPISGNPGYNKGLPVISGVSVDNSTETFAYYVDANASNRLALFKSDSSGLCASVGRKDLLFAVNELSQCQLRLVYSDFDDCNKLRNMTLDALDGLMPSNRVSIVGNPSNSNRSHWLVVLRQNVSYLFENITENNARTVGVCRSVPSGINADVLYAEVGKSNYRPIYMIVGARITYSLSNWMLYCAGVGATSCSRYQSTAQSFTVSSAVRFVPVPATIQSAPTLHMPQTYRRPTVGTNGVSWSDFFYPFMAINQGMNQQLSLAIALIFSVFIIVLAAVLALCGN